MERLEIDNTITKIFLNALDEVNSRIERSEKRTNGLENRSIETIQSEQQKRKTWKKNWAET